MNTDDIITAICEKLCVSVKSIYAYDTHKDVSTARNYIYYYLHYEHSMSYSKMAAKFGKSIRGIAKRISETKFQIENSRKFRESYENAISSIF